jgi:hypothetical protein
MGGNNNHSTVDKKPEEKPKATPAPPNSEKTQTTFTPASNAIDQIRTNCPGITRVFIRERLPEFRSFAEQNNYPPEAMQSRLIRSMTQDFYYNLVTNGNVQVWAKEHNAPLPFRGEQNPDYKKRLLDWVAQGKPAPEKMISKPDFDPMALPGNCDDIVEAEAETLKKKEVA